MLLDGQVKQYIMAVSKPSCSANKSSAGLPDTNNIKENNTETFSLYNIKRNIYF